MHVILRIGVVLLGGVMITGCLSQREALIAQGYPAAYAQGFDDGCHSGKKAGGSYFDEFRKDVRRFDADRDYAQGWSDAYRQCETEEEALERQSRSVQQLNAINQLHDDDFARRVLKGLDTSGLEGLKL